MHEQNQDIKLLLLVIVLSLFVFLRINWGTPSMRKTLLIFTSVETLSKYVPQLIELRKRFYSSVKKIYTEDNIEKNIVKTYAHSVKTKAFEELPLEVKLDALRGYMLGSLNSDEQRTIVAVGNMNPFKLDFNPDDFTYGGLYFYTVAFSFVLGKILRLVSLSQDVAYYFFHPEEVANMYVIVRVISALCIILAFLILYLFIKQFFSHQRINLLLVVVLLFSLPIVLPNAKIAKPHTMGMMFVLLGTYFAYKVFSSEEVKNYLLSGLFYGCAFSVLYVNFISIFMLYFVELTKRKFKIKQVINNKILFATMIFLSIFLLTNWYIIVDFEKFLRRKKELEIIFNYGNFNFIKSIQFCRKFFTFILPWYMLPMFLFGIYWVKKNKEENFYPLATFIFVHILFVVLYVKHENVFIISLPYVAMISVYGIYQFVKHRYYILLCYSFVVIVYLVINTIFQNSLYTKEGNLTLCGEWINRNIQVGSTIGIKDGWFCPGGFPAVNFVDYKLIHVPSNTSWDVEDSLLPEYLISVENDLEQIPGFVSKKGKYRQVYYLSGRKFLFLKRSNLIPTENVDVRVYKKF